MCKTRTFQRVLLTSLTFVRQIGCWMVYEMTLQFVSPIGADSGQDFLSLLSSVQFNRCQVWKKNLHPAYLFLPYTIQLYLCIVHDSAPKRWKCGEIIRCYLFNQRSWSACERNWFSFHKSKLIKTAILKGFFLRASLSSVILTGILLESFNFAIVYLTTSCWKSKMTNYSTFLVSKITNCCCNNVHLSKRHVKGMCSWKCLCIRSFVKRLEIYVAVSSILFSQGIFIIVLHDPHWWACMLYPPKEDLPLVWKN